MKVKIGGTGRRGAAAARRATRGSLAWARRASQSLPESPRSLSEPVATVLLCLSVPARPASLRSSAGVPVATSVVVRGEQPKATQLCLRHVFCTGFEDEAGICLLISQAEGCNS